MDCSTFLTFDQYNYCSLGCMYCFSYFSKSNNPKVKQVKLKTIDSSRMLQTIEGKPTTLREKANYKHFYSKKFLLHWGGLADPFCNFESTNNTGYELIKGLGDLNYPTLFSFKGDAIFQHKFEKLFAAYSSQQNFAFQVSIVTINRDLSRYVEIGVPSPQKRIEAIKLLSDMGYWTILRLRPYIIGVTDINIEELLYKSHEAGIKAISMEFFAMDNRTNKNMKKRYDWLAKIIGVEDLKTYFSTLSPGERGIYKRLNRDIKEPYVKQVYKFCIEHDLVFGCSDPDFKELNMTGSCCALPDKFPNNPLLQNWSKNQLTFHLKQARKRYHKTGKRPLLYFHKVYPKKTTSYLDDPQYKEDHIMITTNCGAVRKNIVMRHMIQQQWNNLHSPTNPRNYFHGKLMPIKLDNEGNLVFRYNPSEYETRWIEQGIDLTV